MLPQIPPLPPKVSISIWLEPEDAAELDKFCTATGRSRGSVIRLLLNSLLHHTPGHDPLPAWREAWAKLVGEAQ